MATILSAFPGSKIWAALAAAGLIGSSGVAAAAAATGTANPEAWGQQVLATVQTCKSELGLGQHALGACVSAFTSKHGTDVKTQPGPGARTGEASSQAKDGEQRLFDSTPGLVISQIAKGGEEHGQAISALARSNDADQGTGGAVETAARTGKDQGEAVSSAARSNASEKSADSLTGSLRGDAQASPSIPATDPDGTHGAAVSAAAQIIGLQPPAGPSTGNQYGSTVSTAARGGNPPGAAVSAAAASNQPPQASSAPAMQPPMQPPSSPNSPAGGSGSQAGGSVSTVAQAGQDHGASVSTAAQSSSGTQQNSGSVSSVAQTGQAQGVAVSGAATSTKGATPPATPVSSKAPSR